VPLWKSIWIQQEHKGDVTGTGNCSRKPAKYGSMTINNISAAVLGTSFFFACFITDSGNNMSAVHCKQLQLKRYKFIVFAVAANI
jgi:hypothetical protein